VLELVRDLVTDLAADGKRVKVCVQQALGQGVFQVRQNLALSVPVSPSRKCSFMLCQLASPAWKCSTLEAVTVPYNWSPLLVSASSAHSSIFVDYLRAAQ
jgi:hypothetical protein